MIELTVEQAEVMKAGRAGPVPAVDPRTKERFVLLRAEEYERLTEDESYDDSPWTREELEALAWEAGKSIGWEEMDEYDDLPEKPRAEGKSSWSASRTRPACAGRSGPAS